MSLQRYLCKYMILADTPLEALRKGSKLVNLSTIYRSFTVKDIEKYAVDSHWNRERVFSFFSHNNVDDMSFPCNTGTYSTESTICTVKEHIKWSMQQYSLCNKWTMQQYSFTLKGICNSTVYALKGLFNSTVTTLN